MTREIVINKCYGRFSLSHKGVMRYAELKGITLFPGIDDITRRIYGEPVDFNSFKGLIHYYKVEPSLYQEKSEQWRAEDGDYQRINSMDWYFSERDIARDDASLLQVVRELGREANGRYASLEIVEIPEGVEFTIEEYDGLEHVAEAHRTWG